MAFKLTNPPYKKHIGSPLKMGNMGSTHSAAAQAVSSMQGAQDAMGSKEQLNGNGVEERLNVIEEKIDGLSGSEGLENVDGTNKTKQGLKDTGGIFGSIGKIFG
jgi:hypothetical protein